MKNREIYELALSFLAESGDRTENGDYEERAGYLLSAFATEVLEVNRMLFEAEEGEAVVSIPLYLSLDEVFPMHERFAAAAGMYLGAMLVLTEDPSLSETLFSRYCDAISSIISSLPMTVERVKDRYGML